MKKNCFFGDSQDYPEIIKHLRTALKWHVLPELDSSFHPAQLKPQDFKRYCSRFPINRLNPDLIPDIFEKSFNAVELLIQIVHRISIRAERKVEKELIADFKRVSGKNNILFRMATASLG